MTNIATSAEEFAAASAKEIASVRSDIPTSYVKTSGSTTVGSATTPVYIKKGVATACDSAIGTIDDVDITVTGSTQDTVSLNTGGSSEYTTTSTSTDNSKSSTYTSASYTMSDNTGISDGTYEVDELLQELVNLSHSHDYKKLTVKYDCNCDCSNNGSS